MRNQFVHKLLKKFFLKKIQFRNKHPFKEKRFEIINNETKEKTKKYNFGNKNKNKIFFVIKRSPGGGFFSNLLYVLYNINYCKRKKYNINRRFCPCTRR